MVVSVYFETTEWMTLEVSGDSNQWEGSPMLLRPSLQNGSSWALG